MSARGRHARPTAHRRRLVAVAGSTALVTAATLTGLPSASAVDTCTVPSLNDFLVSQGPAQTTALAAGKTTLVKLYLATPACLPAGASVRITGGKLNVGNTLTGLPLSASLPLPPLTPSATAPVASSPSDALFLVPGSAVQPNAGNTITFGATIQYSVTLNGSTTPGSVTFAYTPGATPSLSAPLVPTASNLDVLVVPLGTADGGTLSTQYTSSTRNATDQGFGTLRRMLPLSDNALDYATSAGVVIPGSTAPFCANGVNWALTTAPLVEAQRVAWNSIATNSHMDRALGVIDPAVSSGPSTTAGGNSSCADGFGQLAGKPSTVQGVALTDAGPGTDSYARAVTSTSTFGGPTVGSLFTMETAHTTGAVSDTYGPNATSGPNGTNRAFGAHSVYTSGDPTATNRAYNLDTQQPLLPAVARSAMKFSSVGWNDGTTVLEKQDWDYLLCSLLPVPPGATPANNPTLAALSPELTGCSYPGGFGYAAAGTGGSYAVTGTTDGTAAGTNAETVESASTTTDAPVPSSPLRVVQTDANGAVLSNDGIGVHLDSSEHSGDGDPVYDSTTATFGALVPARSGTRHLAIFLGNPSPSNPPLYQRDVTQRPQVQSVNLGPATVTLTVNHPLPGNLRLDLFGTCGSTTSPLVLDQHPTVATPAAGGVPGVAAFATTYDASLLCTNPQISARVHDGIQSSTVALTGGTGGATTSTAEITAPVTGATATTFQSIGLAGRVADAAGNDAARVVWTATSAGTTTTLATTATGTAVPPAGGWPSGTTVITLSGYDASGALLATTSQPVTIQLDSDGDGIPDADENAQSCFGAGAASNPSTAGLDSDGDGYANIDDPAPCVSANNVGVVFDPQSLYKSASGNYVTVYLSRSSVVALSTLKASDLVISQIGGQTVSRLTGSPTALTAVSYALTSPTTATVKFDRCSLVKALGSRLGYTPIFIGTKDGRLRGDDPASPYVFP